MASTFDGKRVSAEWRAVLQFARDQGVSFHLNSGQRTMREQQALYNAYLHGSGVLAARPNANAPHIKQGRADHALDVQEDGTGGRHRLQAFLRSIGIPTSLTVPGENWHMEADSQQDLITAAFRINSLRAWRKKRARAVALRKVARVIRWRKHWDKAVKTADHNIQLRKKQLGI